MPRKNLPSIVPTRVHLETGDTTACGYNLLDEDYSELRTSSYSGLVTCARCFRVLGYSEDRIKYLTKTRQGIGRK